MKQYQAYSLLHSPHGIIKNQLTLNQYSPLHMGIVKYQLHTKPGYTLRQYNA